MKQPMPKRPSPPAFPPAAKTPFRWGLILAAGLTLACGSGGGSAGPSLPPVRPTPPPAQVPPAPTDLPLHIEGLYITQGTQRLDRSVPLVKDRDAFLRVFVLANSWTGPAPSVRVRIQDRNGRELLDRELPPPGPGVPRTLREAARDEAWGTPLDGELIQPGNTVLASLEPPPGTAHGNLSYPADGSPLPMQVVAVAPLHLVLIPVRTGGKVGLVTSRDRPLGAWLTSLTRMFPLGQVTVRAGNEYVTSLDPHQRSQGLQLLEALEVMRLASGRDDRNYFFGVYPADLYGRNETGLAYRADSLGLAHRTGIVYDGHMPDTRSVIHFPNVLAHELGHTLGLRHAPCGPADCYPEQVEPAYPPDGSIGACGFDVRSKSPFDPVIFKDVMSYCSPVWSGDYDWKAILAYRAGEPLGAARGLAARDEDCLLVRGLLRQGRAELEAAFQVRREPLPPRPGEYLLTALDARGAVLASVPFAPDAVEDGTEPDLGAFDFVIPMTQAMKDGLAILRVSRGGLTLGERHAAGHGIGADDPRPHASRDGHGLVRLVWNPQAAQEVLVKDARTGEVLSLGAGGRLALGTRAHELECLFSDGVRTRARKVPVQ